MEKTVAFECKTSEKAGFQVLSLKNRENWEFVSIIPDLGGTVYRLAFAFRGSLFDVLRFDSDQELVLNPWYRGRILFPFNDRIPGGLYNYRGNTYQLACNEGDSAIHGFLSGRNMDIIAIEGGEKSSRVVLEDKLGADEIPGYPFALSIQLEYLLKSSGFSLSFRIKNTGQTIAPLSVGWHPYFRLPGGQKNLRLRAAFASYVELDDLIPTGKISSTTESGYDFNQGRSIKDLSIDLAFTAPPDGRVLLHNGTEGIETRQDPRLFSFVQLFTPPCGDSLAIEPVSAAANAFNIPQLGRRELEVGSELKSSVSVSHMVIK
jgi:aldose 1-epimerase